jgi:hypothetical protein
MEDSLVEKYQKMLEDNTNTGAVLTAFLFEVHEKEFNAELIPLIAKLRKLYGANSVFYAVCESAFVEDFVLDKDCIRLLAYFCKKRALKEDSPGDINLLVHNKERKKSLGTRKIKIPNPFEGEKDE